MEAKYCFSWFPLAILVLTVLIDQLSCSRIPKVKKPHLDLRVTAGKDVTSLTKFPSQVSLQQLSGRHICGGSILNSAFVVSAAHCFVSTSRPDTVRIVTAAVNLKSPGRAYSASRIIIHANFSKTYSIKNGETMVNDIALLKVEPQLTISLYADPIKFPSPNRILRGSAYVIGWGQMSGGKTPNILQEAMVKIISDQECDYFYGGVGVIRPNTQLCVLGTGSGACMGDSGGPLFLARTGEQIGIVSFGDVPCGYGPTVFTQLSSFRDWIVANIGGSRLYYYNDEDTIDNVNIIANDEVIQNDEIIQNDGIIDNEDDTSVIKSDNSAASETPTSDDLNDSSIVAAGESNSC